MITCIGIGPGDIAYLTGKASSLIASSQVIAGFDSVINIIRPLIPARAEIVTMTYKDQTERLNEVALAHRAGKQCLIAFMGDIHFSGFQFLERVERACGHPVETVPGVSSAQVLASRGKVCFDETTFITFHRRGDITSFQRHLATVLRDNRNAIVIPRPWDFMPKDIAQYLIEHGVPSNHQTEVWENLTASEAHWQGTLSECTGDFSDMSIMLIRTLNPISSQIEPVPQQ